MSQGRLDGRILTCAAHCWKYDVSTGKGVNPANAVLRRFAVRVDSGGVLVDVEEPS